jgi:hypothetical protein
MMLNGLRKFRIAKRQKGILLQIESKESEPQSSESNGQKKIKP